MVQVSDLDPSLDLQYVSEVTGETYVYNIGDMAWSESWDFSYLSRCVALDLCCHYRCREATLTTSQSSHQCVWSGSWSPVSGCSTPVCFDVKMHCR